NKKFCNATAFTQRELVAHAFANDNVVEGTWGGKGVKPSKARKK
ncbi:14379_t:CDS:2, partial [Gigaspora margarita]